jgi:hypothetical protein
LSLLALLDLLCQLQASADEVAEIMLAQAPQEVQLVILARARTHARTHARTTTQHKHHAVHFWHMSPYSLKRARRPALPKSLQR